MVLLRMVVQKVMIVVFVVAVVVTVFVVMMVMTVVVIMMVVVVMVVVVMVMVVAMVFVVVMVFVVMMVVVVMVVVVTGVSSADGSGNDDIGGGDGDGDWARPCLPLHRPGPGAGGWAAAVPPPGRLLRVDAGHAAAGAEAQGQVGRSCCRTCWWATLNTKVGRPGQGARVVPWASAREDGCSSDPVALPGTLCAMGMVSSSWPLCGQNTAPSTVRAWSPMQVCWAPGDCLGG